MEPSDEPVEGWPTESGPHEAFTNPVLGHEHRVLERGTDEDGEFLRSEGRYRADAIHFGEHVHVRQDETWTVLSGELVVAMNGDERTLGEGDQVTVPSGTPHRQRTPPGTETRVLHELRPPGHTHAFIRALAALARDGRTDSEGNPSLLQAAVVFDAYPGTYETGVPVAIQKWAFKALAVVGRLQGYRADHST